MSESGTSNAQRWYVIHTKPWEEGRAESNLLAWGLETFAPKRKERRSNEFTGKATYYTKPLFPRYIFARFDPDRLMHKVRMTRGVGGIVNVSGCPAEVDDEAIALMRSRVGEDGFVLMEEALASGDPVRIKEGAFQGLSGVFDRSLDDGARVTILLEAISYRARVTLGRDSVEKICA
ncbi:MAG TPA: transcription termination/antitermination NusG family protein [Pyrinomonadaceae bacterium]|nr:transcription termination/antitermination NusG family protein [Pyrinomonadaceae bacterium]